MSSTGVARAAIAAVALGLVWVAASAMAQPDDGAVVLPAKLDAEGASQMLIPIRVNGHTFWCNADSGGSRVLSLDLTKALNAGLQPNATGTNAISSRRSGRLDSNHDRSNRDAINAGPPSDG
jgi:hypothetical protein